MANVIIECVAPTVTYRYYDDGTILISGCMFPSFLWRWNHVACRVEYRSTHSDAERWRPDDDDAQERYRQYIAGLIVSEATYGDV